MNTILYRTAVAVAVAFLSVTPVVAQEMPVRAAAGTTTRVIVAGTSCFLVTNQNGQDLLVPNRTVAEFESFQQAVQSGQLSGITIKPCN